MLGSSGVSVWQGAVVVDSDPMREMSEMWSEMYDGDRIPENPALATKSDSRTRRRILEHNGVSNDKRGQPAKGRAAGTGTCC